MSTQGSFEPSGVIANVLRHDRVNSSPSGRGPRFFLGSDCSLVSLINHSKTLFRGICLLPTSKACHSESAAADEEPPEDASASMSYPGSLANNPAGGEAGTPATSEHDWLMESVAAGVGLRRALFNTSDVSTPDEGPILPRLRSHALPRTHKHELSLARSVRSHLVSFPDDET